MSLFFNKKRTKADDNANVEKNSVNLICPQCEFEQSDPRMAVSTYCRGCGTHYKIIEGKAVAHPSTPHPTFARDTQTTETPDTSASITPTATPPSPASPPPPSPRTRSVPPTSPRVKKSAASTGFLQRKIPPRNVLCFSCDHEHQAPAEASSTLCPACGGYISLKDFDIKDHWNRRIQTRGNVTIHKKAVVNGITIHCHDLTVLGELTGGVHCSGDFTIRSHGKIMGKVQCKRLIIEKKARVEFANPVHCMDAIIDGNVTGHFTCTGKLQLKKKATLTGDIQVATMTVEEGARHNGRLSIGQ
ncbi:MAG: polymer-forming cytoskeletal protein [Verrucomicrobiae bacterium]|nr:polymer-forming cytoskeletal protein [Verrucomicrobiae bacterium]NNJ43464.1 polymer-forming cytoskeletal protein [Akkermansiaceae bacterium]